MAASRAAVPGRRAPDAARDDARRHGRVARRLRAQRTRAPPRPASTGSNCTARTATCCRAFISPLTNQRDDDYGGSLANRLRFPLEVFAAVRAAWPQHKPMSVRISAHDWVEGGITPDDAVEIARAFKAAGADMIDCSSGQVSAEQQPVYGRMYQTPFADRMRNEVGIATIAVGAICEADHVNSIIAAGRADLCAIARPHLANPAWTLQRSGEDRLHADRVAEAVRQRQDAESDATLITRVKNRREATPGCRVLRSKEAEPDRADVQPHEPRRSDPAARRPEHRPGSAHVAADDHHSLRLWLRLLACSTDIETEIRKRCARSSA